MKIGFGKGMVFGAVVGGVYGLLKTPRTGKENRVAAKSYLEDTTVSVQDVTERVKDLKAAISNLTTESQYLASDFSKEMNDTVQAFTYEAEPRMRRIQDQADKLNRDLQEAQTNLQQTSSEDNKDD